MATITTPVTELFGIKHPILLAGEPCGEWRVWHWLMSSTHRYERSRRTRVSSSGHQRWRVGRYRRARLYPKSSQAAGVHIHEVIIDAAPGEADARSIADPSHKAGSERPKRTVWR